MEKPTIRLGVIGTRGFPCVEGGVESHCRHLYDRLEKDFAIVVYRRKPYLMKQSLEQSSPAIRFVDLPSTRIKGVEALLHTFLSCMHLVFHRVDVVHVHNIGPGLFIPLLRLLGFKVVLTYHSANYEHDKWNGLEKCLLRFCEGVALRFSHRIIFVNSYQMAKFPAAIRRKSFFIPNGVEPVSRTGQTDFLQANGIRVGRYLLFVGRVVPEKGLDTLLRAVREVDFSLQVVIAGSVQCDRAYQESLCRLDTHRNLIFLGSVFGEPLRQLYSHARLFVLPSLSEGCPLALLEAMNYGLPLAVSDLPATRLVRLSPDDYAQPASVSDWKRLLVSKLRYPYASPLHYDLSSFDWDRIAGETRQVFRLLCKEG
ncbi:MAG: glycosyltransferase family 4 protein [Bacteroidales bacterium]|nr:glycosyltransferase family 4 protein [Bacteroidales bacterium]